MPADTHEVLRGVTMRVNSAGVGQVSSLDLSAATGPSRKHRFEDHIVIWFGATLAGMWEYICMYPEPVVCVGDCGQESEHVEYTSLHDARSIGQSLLPPSNDGSRLAGNMRTNDAVCDQSCE